MNKIKSLAAGAAAVLLTATLASAQPVDNTDWTNYTGDTEILFSVTVEPLVKLEVHQAATLVPVTETASTHSGILTSGGTNGVVTDLKPVGTVDVLTNLASWNVTVKSLNNGKLINEADGSVLKRVRTGTVTDAVIRANVCYGTGPSAAATATLNGGSAGTTCTRAANITNIAQAALIDATGLVSSGSLGTILGKTGGYFDQTDLATGATGQNGHFAIFAFIDASYAELAGDGTYEEKLEFTLVSGF